MEQVFSFSSALVMPFWFLMIVFPHWRWTNRIMQSLLVFVPVALLYALLVLPRFSDIFLEVVNPTLSGISVLLGTPEGATIGWVHFLAFDLFVGRWVYLNSRENSISAWIMAPVMFFCLMLGPIGLLLYLGVRLAYSRKRGLSIQEGQN